MPDTETVRRMTDNKSLGQIAYEGYFTTQNPNYEKCGVVTPYNEISCGERENWDDAAQAVRKVAVEACIARIDEEIDSLQEGLMTDAGLSNQDRVMMNAQIAAFMELKEIYRNSKERQNG